MLIMFSNLLFAILLFLIFPFSHFTEYSSYGVWLYVHWRSGKCGTWRAFCHLRFLEECHEFNVSSQLKQDDGPWDVAEKLKIVRFVRENEKLFMRGYDEIEECNNDSSLENFDTEFELGKIGKCKRIFKFKKLGITFIRINSYVEELTDQQTLNIFDEMFEKTNEYITIQYFSGPGCSGETIGTEVFKVNNVLLKFFFKSFKKEFCGDYDISTKTYELSGKCLYYSSQGLNAIVFCEVRPNFDWIGNKVLRNSENNGKYEDNKGLVTFDDTIDFLMDWIFYGIGFLLVVFIICLALFSLTFFILSRACGKKKSSYDVSNINNSTEAEMSLFSDSTVGDSTSSGVGEESSVSSNESM